MYSVALLWLWSGSALLLATLISLMAPLTPQASRGGSRIGLALLLSPFLMGVVLALVLHGLPRLRPDYHILIAVLVQSGVALAVFNRSRRQVRNGSLLEDVRNSLPILLSCAPPAAYLLRVAASAPLMEADALEYHLVAKEIFFSGSLTHYPFIDSSESTQGVYFPVTHPPFYVALIYGVFAAFNSIEYSWLSKLIPALFLTASAIALGTLVASRSRAAGVAAALLCFSIPLITVGAEAGAIDPLAFAGTTLLIFGFVATDWRKTTAPFFVGGLAGLSVWPHSLSLLVATLFVLLSMWYLILKFGREAWRLILSLISAAILVGGFPYLKNIVVFGSALSDSPPGFNRPDLEWSLYFQHARNIYDLSSSLIFGVLRGWVRFDSFALTFWIASFATFIVIIRGRRGLVQSLILRSAVRHPWVLALVFFWSFIMVGFVSLALGEIDFLKNDRYALIILPSAIFLTGVSLSPDRSAGSASVIVSGAKAMLIFSVFVQIVVVFSFLLVKRDLSSDAKKVRSAHAPERIFPDALIDASSSVLAFRPGDFFYSSRRLVSYLDPVVLDAYTLADPQAIADELNTRSIRYVQVPEYMLPGFYNTGISSLVADPNLATLIFHDRFRQLYALNVSSSDERLPSDSLEFVSVGSATSLKSAKTILNLPIRGLELRSFGPKLEVRSVDYERDSVLSSVLEPIVIQRETYRVRHGRLQTSTWHAIGARRMARSPEVRLTLRGTGVGFVSVYVSEISCADESEVAVGYGDPQLAGNFVVGGARPTVEFARRWRLSANVCAVDVIIERPVGERRRIDISEISLQMLQRKNARADE